MIEHFVFFFSSQKNFVSFRFCLKYKIITNVLEYFDIEKKCSPTFAKLFLIFQKSNLKRNVSLIKKKIRQIERIVYYRIVNILWSFVQIIVVKKFWSYLCFRFVQILIFFLKLAYVSLRSTSFYEQLLSFRLDFHLSKTFAFVLFRSS